ncbi:excinuclease ABC subunit C [Desulfohalotomaculum tongense]|uniref:excinuclease ABC subunit UvrC n=1 Tax=Desulforadius tongensis TaxID=1216062 RepID=UPI00195D84B7|nr:excinuclease ABC subunit UvrC [Desulforadius tongensis]MBM7853650.1 excinuclease ABC subunit C [Desulforadius tongensis]
MNWEEKLKHIPARPGVYIYRDAGGEIIYVGKAKVLKNRVRSYFQNSAHRLPKTRSLVERIADIEYIVTDSEVEALILECNLIKEHRPRYNVLLKDDKSYPYIKVTLGEDYPRVFTTRRPVKDGSRYFGPYTQVGAVNETLKLLKKLFLFRTCSNRQFASRSRPCLNFHINRCQGPCTKNVDKEQYREAIKEIILFLEGRHGDLVKRLEERMHRAAAALDFEKAAELRDQLQAVKKVMERQKMVSAGLEDQDVVAMAGGLDEVCVMVFFIRGGRLIGREHHLLKNTGGLSRGEVLAGFLKQYYAGVEFIPRSILLSEDVGEEAELIACWLSQKRGSKVTVKTPKRGEKARLVEMAAENALLVLKQIELEGRNKGRLNEAAAELAAALGLPGPPLRMECYDISNIQGAEQVASMVVFEEGKPKKSEYRRFKIRTVEGPNDFAAMQEVIHRRFSRGLEEKKLLRSGQISTKEAKFHRFPDLVIIDGGKGQLSAARAVMKSLGVGDIPTFGLAKKEELLFTEHGSEPVVLPRNSQALYLVQRLRDEAHRFAVTYHRSLRTKRNLKSLLDEIEGVGPARKKALLKEFKTIEGIQRAELHQLEKVPGMNKKAAKAVYEFFRPGREE